MRLFQEEGGSAFVEVALILPLFIVVLVSAVQGALIVQRLIRVTDAATVGARFGTVAGNGSNLTGMQNAATSAANNLPSFSATATTYCTCSPGGSTVSCTSSCSGQATPAQYVQVTTSSTTALLFKVYGTSGTFPMSSVATMRVAWGQ